MGKVRKKISKLIPKEAKPFLPYAALMIPGLQGAGGFLANQGITNTILQKALIAGATKGVTDDKASLKDVGITAALAATPEALSQFSKTGEAAKLSMGDPGFFTQQAELGAAKAAGYAEQNPFKTAGAMGSVDLGIKQAELNKEALEKYNADLLAQGIGDKTARRSAIFQIFQNAGYDDDEVNSMLDVYKYADGGRAGFNKRGLVNEPGGYAGTGGGRGGGTGTYDQFYNSKKPKEGIETIKGIETIQIGEEEDDGDKKISIKDFITAMEGDDSIEDGLDYAQQGLSMLNQGGAKPTPMMRLGLEEGGSSNKEGILSITDGDEEGPSGVMYSDEKGNPITKEEAMKLFNKQAEKENKSKKKKKSKKNNIESELREETPNAYPFMMGTSPITHLRRYLKNNKANGGVIGLMNGGNPAMEMDYRQGGFIPVGAKERADDVPARLSKNEFVMTADAVRAAGGGSVNQGAKRMYELMNNLEAKV